MRLVIIDLIESSSGNSKLLKVLNPLSIVFSPDDSKLFGRQSKDTVCTLDLNMNKLVKYQIPQRTVFVWAKTGPGKWEEEESLVRDTVLFIDEESALVTADQRHVIHLKTNTIQTFDGWKDIKVNGMFFPLKAPQKQ